MTSTTGADSHPEVAEISALAEGILPPDSAAAVRDHLAGCALCADVRDSLEEIRGLLGTLPGPPRMPADVAGRIDAALAAEALLDTVLPGVPRGTPAGPHVPRETSAAPGGHSAASTGPGRPGKRPRDRRRWGRGVLAAASAAGVLLLGGVIYQSVSSGGSGESAADSSARKASAAGSDTVAGQVQQLLGKSSGSVRTPMVGGQYNSNSGGEQTDIAPNHAPTSVPACVLKATSRSATPLAAERESFQGKDAYLLVLPNPTDSTSVDAYVVSASCTASSPGAVLFRATYPR